MANDTPRDTAKKSPLWRKHWDEIEEEVRWAAAEVASWQLHQALERCESVIEVVLGAALYQQCYGFDGPFVIRPQADVMGGKYRVDFLMEKDEYLPGSLAIECDGHDFHERTKEQAARDRRRDRELTGAGFRVFRFTGSEIAKDPLACVQEILDYHTSCVLAAMSKEKAELAGETD